MISKLSTLLYPCPFKLDTIVYLPFEITFERRNAWLECMDKALDEAAIEEPYRSAIFERLSLTATHMINTDA